MSRVLPAKGSGPQPAKPTLTLARLIQQRLLVGLLVGFLITGTSVAVGYLAYYEVARAFNEASTDAGIARGLAVTLNDAVVAEVLHTRSYIIAGDEESLTLRDLAAQDFERAYAQLEASLAELQAGLVSLPETAPLTLQELGALQDEYDALADEIIPLLGSGQTEAAISLFDEQSDSVVLRLLATKRNLRADINAWEDQAERVYFLRTSQIVLVTAFVFLLGSLASGLFVTRRLAHPISALNYFEHALIETAQNGASNPTQLPRSLPEQTSPVFHAYDLLIARLRESEAARLEFVSKVVHSFRSPLGSIIGYAELMSDPTLRPADADLESYARIITKQATRLGQIVEQVVTAARMDERQVHLILAPVRLSALLSELITEAKQRHQREIIFDNQLASTIIPGDELYLRQAFWHLIDNAAKFSPHDTPIRVTLRCTSTPTRAEVTVADQGYGIDEADQPILFTRFGRIHNQRTRGLAGSGLGLFITKYIIDQHQGQITLQSQANQGTTIVVTLPIDSGDL